MTTKRAKEPAPVKVGDLLEGISPVNSVDGLERQAEKQRLGYLARPFILCGLSFKPKKVYKRVNGNQALEIIASPDCGLPFGADTQVLVWVSIRAVLRYRLAAMLVDRSIDRAHLPGSPFPFPLAGAETVCDIPPIAHVPSIKRSLKHTNDLSFAPGRSRHPAADAEGNRLPMQGQW